MTQPVFLDQQRARSKLLVPLVVLLCIVGEQASAQSAIDVGDVVIDPPTVSSLGVSVPIVSGDDNYNATAAVLYRESGSTEWRTGLPLFRVRPETISQETPPESQGYTRPGEQFAGSIFYLQPGTTYEVQIDVSDPDGGNRVQVFQTTTRRVPRSEPLAPLIVTVTNSAEFDTALQSASPGDVISLAAGTYAGRFNLISRDGTEDNPIVIRGPTDGGEAILDGAGQSVALDISGSDFVYVEHLRIVGVTGVRQWGLQLSGTNLVARHLVIEADNGINAGFHQNRGFYICDNDVRGPTNWPVVAVGANVPEKNWIGIHILGQGHTVCHNNLSDFGSTLLIEYANQSNPSHNIAIDIHNNDIVGSADDGIEFDGSLRNVRAWNNRIQNALMSMSFSPVWGGPIYAFKNVIYNPAAAPFKLNNDPSGVLLFHNTTFRYAETDIFGPYDGNAWPQLGEPANYAANTIIRNNIMVGNDSAIFIRQEMPLFDMDYNGYSPNGTFGYQSNGVVNSYQDIEAFRAGTGFETNGTLLELPIFEIAPPASLDYKISGPTLDFVLHSQSNAVDQGDLLPNINDDFVGSAPDLGATELGGDTVIYGVRNVDTVPPAPPTDLVVTVP